MFKKNMRFLMVMVFIHLASFGLAKEKKIEKLLKKLPGVTLEEIDNENPAFSKTFKLMITQPLDHKDPSKGYFQEKVYLSHKSVSKPMVMFLNGYNVNSNKSFSELSTILDANQIHVEHRFFGESCPEGMDWTYLNVWQAAADHHHIVEVLKQIYTGKWVSTGISKGGMVTAFHRRYYPDDVVVSVPFVAPINLEAEDRRINIFLHFVGPEWCREKLEEFQYDLLKDRDVMLPVFEEMSKKNNSVYPFSMDSIFELSVMETGFAFWQWSADCEMIPDEDASPEDKVGFLFKIDAPGFFTVDGIKGFYPYFYQAYSEIGMYSYSTEDFRDVMKAYPGDISNYRTFIPENVNIQYNPATLKDIYDWLKTDGNNMIYVYGEYDPWSATAFEPSPETNALRFIKHAGNHRTRIANLDPEDQQKLYDALSKWLEMEVIPLSN